MVDCTIYWGWTLSHPNSLIVMHFQFRLCIHLCIQYYVNVSSSSLLFVTRKPNISFSFQIIMQKRMNVKYIFFVCLSLHKFVKLHVNGTVSKHLMTDRPTDQKIQPNQRYVLFFFRNLIKRFFAIASALVVIYWYHLLCFGLYWLKSVKIVTFFKAKNRK